MPGIRPQPYGGPLAVQLRWAGPAAGGIERLGRRAARQTRVASAGDGRLRWWLRSGAALAGAAGQDVYRFYSIFNDRLLANTDLMRVRVHFEQQ